MQKLIVLNKVYCNNYFFFLRDTLYTYSLLRDKYFYLFNSLQLVSLQKVHTNEKYVKRCRHHNKPMLSSIELFGNYKVRTEKRK